MSLKAQTGNRDYSDSPIPNTGPNIIFIYVDDLGYGDLGNFWQNQRTGDQKMVTPNLDILANEGAMLTHHYTAAPVCAPARASLLEGLHQGHSSIRNNQFDAPLKSGLTLAEMLRKSGYRTMHIGKAGLAGNRQSTEPDPQTLSAHPLKRGFDQFYGYLYHIQGHQHYPQNGTTNQRAYFTDGYTNVLTGTDLTYTTDVYTAKSKQWITIHENMRPEQPFFLYLAYDSPHAALQVPTQAYPEGGGLSGGLQWTGASSSTPWVNTASGTRDSFIHADYANKNWNETAKRHATMIRRIDNAVADLIQLLKDLNIDNNTLIVFSTDNGPHNETGSGGLYKQDPQFFQSYANMNGIKRDMWEAGIRVPAICRYPGVIPEQSVVTFPSGQWDWLATFADLANVAIPQYTDGVSLMPSLIQNHDSQIDKGYTYHEYSVGSRTPSYADFEVSKRNRYRGQMQVIRLGDYKGIRYDIIDHNTTPFEIYNVVTDEREEFNLATSMPSLQQAMKEKVLQVRKREATAARPYDSELIPSKTVELPVEGLRKSVFVGKHEWVPNFEYLSPQETAVVSGIDIGTTLTSEFGLFYKGYIKIPEDGLYSFYLESGSKYHIMLHDIHLLDNDYSYTEGEVSAQLHLKSGYHPIRIGYQQNIVGAPFISLKLEGPNMVKSVVPNSMYFVSNALDCNNPEASTDYSFENVITSSGREGALANLELDTQAGNTGGVSYTTGHNGGQAYNFDGTNTLTTNASSTWQGITGTNARTITAWINIPATGANLPIVNMGGTATGARYTFKVNTGGKLRIEIQGSGIDGQTVLPTNQWIHVAVTMPDNGKLGDNILYVNGVQDSASSSTNVVNTVANRVLVGAQMGNGGSAVYPFNGKIDDLRIYECGLTPEQIVKEMNGESLSAEDVYNTIVDVKAFPVPTHGIVNIPLPSSNELKYSIYSVQGQEISVGVLGKSRNVTTFDFSSFKSGIYIIKMQDDNGVIFRTKVVKK